VWFNMVQRLRVQHRLQGDCPGPGPEPGCALLPVHALRGYGLSYDHTDIQHGGSKTVPDIRYTAGTDASGQTFISEATYLGTAGNLGGNFKSFSQASTGDLAIYITVADATTGDAWTLEFMKVELQQ
jgi:hypothetical protein